MFRTLTKGSLSCGDGAEVWGSRGGRNGQCPPQPQRVLPSKSTALLQSQQRRFEFHLSIQALCRTLAKFEDRNQESSCVNTGLDLHIPYWRNTHTYSRAINCSLLLRSYLRLLSRPPFTMPSSLRVKHPFAARLWSNYSKGFDQICSATPCWEFHSVKLQARLPSAFGPKCS